MKEEFKMLNTLGAKTQNSWTRTHCINYRPKTKITTWKTCENNTLTFSSSVTLVCCISPNNCSTTWTFVCLQQFISDSFHACNKKKKIISQVTIVMKTSNLSMIINKIKYKKWLIINIHSCWKHSQSLPKNCITKV